MLLRVATFYAGPRGASVPGVTFAVTVKLNASDRLLAAALQLPRTFATVRAEDGDAAEAIILRKAASFPIVRIASHFQP
jgi:hypothetical protein